MYSPPYNQVEDRAEVLSFMRANNFAVVVTATGGEPRASHLPVLVEERLCELHAGIFQGHLWADLEA